MKLLFISTCLFLFVACKKDEVVTATITINTPAATDTVAYGSTLHLTGSVAGSAEMHGYSVTFTNQLTGLSVYSQVHEVHAESYTIDESWTNNVVDTCIVKLLIDVEKDHDGNMEMKEISVVCLPQ